MSLERALSGKRLHPIKDWGKSLTRQSEEKSANINVIMAKYMKTGVLPPATREGFFADVSTVGDYREALDRVMRMDDYFVHLDPSIRKRFDNDPAVFLDFVADPANLPELEEIGVIAKSAGEVPEVPPRDNGVSEVAGRSVPEPAADGGESS